MKFVWQISYSPANGGSLGTAEKRLLVIALVVLTVTTIVSNSTNIVLKISRNYTSCIFRLMVKFGLSVQPSGIWNSAFQFLIIRPSGLGLTALPQIIHAKVHDRQTNFWHNIWTGGCFSSRLNLLPPYLLRSQGD